MKCPRCGHELRGAERLEANLVADRCRACGGHWVSSFQYWKWRATVASAPASLPDSGDLTPPQDTSHAMMCPQCGHILGRHKVGHGFNFHLDYCATCGGMWFDPEEWEILRDHDLHTDVHRIFTAVWQRERRAEEGRRSMAEVYERRFGPEDYDRLREFRDWLDAHAERGALLQYLNDPDPYQT